MPDAGISGDASKHFGLAVFLKQTTVHAETCTRAEVARNIPPQNDYRKRC